MSDRDSTLMQRREFVQSSAAATAAAVTMASIRPGQAMLKPGPAQPKKTTAKRRPCPRGCLARPAWK